MNKKSLQLKQYELNSIWASLEPCIKERLVSIDSMTRTLYKECMTFGVPHHMIDEYFSKQFSRLWSEVIKESVGNG